MTSLTKNQRLCLLFFTQQLKFLFPWLFASKGYDLTYLLSYFLKYMHGPKDKRKRVLILVFLGDAIIGRSGSCRGSYLVISQQIIVRKHFYRNP